MISIVNVTDLSELIRIMPLMLEGYDAMNKKQKVFDVDREGFVMTLFGILNTVPNNGILVAYDGIEAVGYGVAYDDSPTYSKTKHLLLWALYVRPLYSKAVRKMLFDAAEELAKEQGYDYLHAFNSRFSGACFSLFEKIYGMRRARIQFSKKL